MTVLDDRPITHPTPAPPPPLRDRGALAPWRLAARLARREVRRRPGRTVLAALLIAAPVFAMTVGSVLVRTEDASNAWDRQFALQWPGADVVVQFSDPDLDPAALPAGSRVVDYVWVYSEVQRAGGTSVAVEWTDLPVDDPMVAGAIEVVDGRLPEPGEVLLDVEVADELDLEVGDVLSPGRPSGEWTVAGVGRYRADYWRRVVVAPGFERDRIVEQQRTLNTAIDLPPGTPPADAVEIARSIGGMARYEQADPYSTTGSTLAWGWVGGVLALVAVGIIVTAAFATSARRQLVAVGQLASNGATPAVIRRTLALQGTWTALVGVAVGMGAGLAVLPWTVALVERWIVRSEMAGYSLVPFDLVVIGATALVAGTLAAVVPARSLAKVPIMAALAGRRPLGAPPRWLVPTGVALTLGGLGLLALAGVGAANAADNGSSTDLFALAVVLAAVAVVFGMVCATPLVVERAGRLASRLPLSPRLALRGMARARTRSAAVVAAIAVAVGGSVAVAMWADDAVVYSYYGDAYLPEDALVIRPVQWDVTPEGDALNDPPLLPAMPLDAEQRAAVEAALPGAEIEPLVMAGFDPPPFRWSSQEIFWPVGEGPLIATPALLDLIGLSDRDEALLDDVGVILVRDQLLEPGTSDEVWWGEYWLRGERTDLRPSPSFDVPRFGFGFSAVLLTEAKAEELGFTPVVRGAIVRSDDGTVPETAASRIRAGVGGSVPYGASAFLEPGDAAPATSGVSYDVTSASQFRVGDPADLWRARALIVAVAVLLSSLVVAIGLSLAAAEGRDERDTLTIVGATPATMRRQTATRAATLALTGIVLGIPTGFLPTWVLWRAVDGNDWPSFPWVTSLLLLAAVPLAVAGAAWLASAVGQRLRPVSPTRRD